MNMHMLPELLHIWDFTCLMRHLPLYIWLQVLWESREISAISIVAFTCSVSVSVVPGTADLLQLLAVVTCTFYFF